MVAYFRIMEWSLRVAYARVDLHRGLLYFNHLKLAFGNVDVVNFYDGQRTRANGRSFFARFVAGSQIEEIHLRSPWEVRFLLK